MDLTQEIPLPPEVQALSVLVQQSPETFLHGNAAMKEAALTATKHIFDLSLRSEQSSKAHISDLLSSLAPSEAPQTRSKATAHTPATPNVSTLQTFHQTPLKALFAEGMDEGQIWEQLDLRTKAVCRMLDFVLEGGGEEDEAADLAGPTDEEETEESDSDEQEGEEEDGMLSKEEMDAFMAGDFDQLDSEGDDWDMENDEGSEHSSEGSDEEEEERASDDESMEEDELDDSPRKPPLKRKRGVSELDDGFFDLEDFNAEAEQAEARSSTKGTLAIEDDSEDEDEDVDLFADVDALGGDDEEVKDLFYRDFFEAPSASRPSSSSTRKKARFEEPKGKGKQMKGHKGDSGSEEEPSEEESSIQGGDDVGRLKRDLFEEEEAEVPDDMTGHERRMAELKAQIAELEAENVGKKDWMLMGEATSRSRPQNALLEEDLEFERVMKAIPVVTEESVKTLEEKIKARILEGRFDDVVRIKPIEDKPFLPSKLLELQDKKSTQSLAQIYENEYIAEQEGRSTDDRDGKLQKEHDEITALWEGLCGKLDALCNAHFVPKPPKATISTVTNVASTSLESALPTAKSTSTLLAPEEVFSTTSAVTRDRSELTPTEKRSIRNKERKVKAKQRQKLDSTVDKLAKHAGKGLGAVKRQKQAALESVVKHGKGVTVVGKAAKSLGKHPKKQRS